MPLRSDNGKWETGTGQDAIACFCIYFLPVVGEVLAIAAEYVKSVIGGQAVGLG
jgi:hypothetical protein